MIKSKPSTKEYRENYDRIFNIEGPNHFAGSKHPKSFIQRVTKREELERPCSGENYVK
jgi:hypothetical protein